MCIRSAREPKPNGTTSANNYQYVPFQVEDQIEIQVEQGNGVRIAKKTKFNGINGANKQFTSMFMGTCPVSVPVLV